MPKVREYKTQKNEMRKMFRDALYEKNWTQKHLAEICKIPPSRISDVFTEPENHNFSTLFLVCKKLDIKEIPII